MATRWMLCFFRRQTSLRNWFGVVTSVVLWAALGSTVSIGCRRVAPDRPAPSATSAQVQELQVLKEGRFLFTYVEAAGTFSTTDKPEIIPEGSRKMVRVVDPAQTKNPDATEVYVASVKELLQAGKTTARPMAREVFETAAIAQLPPGASSARQAHAPGPTPDGGVKSPVSAPGQPVVTIYGTSWCGACRTARQYFSDKKIPFADKDIEADAEAARELSEKAQKAGIPTDRVPVLDVRGRLLLGFDPQRIEALLGNPT